MMEYKVGFFERVIAFVFLLCQWTLVAVLTLSVISEHGDGASELQAQMPLLNGAMLVILFLLCFGRPIGAALPDLYRQAKEVVA